MVSVAQRLASLVMPLDVVGGDGLAFHDPFQGELAVDDVVVGFQGDVADRDVVVVDDGGLVVEALVRRRVAGFREFHLCHAVVLGIEGLEGVLAGVEGGSGVGGHGFVVEVPVGDLYSEKL